MGSGRRAGLVALILSTLAGPAIGAQGAEGPALSRALDLEGEGKCREAIPFFRTALQGNEQPAGALFGLERCMAEAGHPDSLLAILDSVLLRRPRDPIVRTIQLRTLTTAQRHDAAKLAFAHWVNVVPQDATPYREYARLLLDNGLTFAADTVLQQATLRLGGAQKIAAELAELKGALGMWESSATHWRQAMSYAPYLEASAVFVLGGATGASRDTIRTILSANPVELQARRILANLELRWTSARQAWDALRALAPSDSVVEAWLQFATQAEQRDSWLVAKDAYAAALGTRRTAGLVVKASTAALQGGEPATALAYADSMRAWSDTTQRATMTLVRLRALGQMGRAADAEAVLAARGRELDPVAHGDAVRAVAWAWVRVGDVARARATLAKGGEESDERAAAWMSLYDGDLHSARGGLRRLDDVTNDAVLALAVFARTRVDTSPGIGRAFLALARSDTAAAAKTFESAATEVADAAPLLLSIAARLYLATPDSLRAETIWKGLVESHADAPEAAEADLEWARALRRHGNPGGAVTRLEHLILTYPRSALVPQARRELELARGGIPPMES